MALSRPSSNREWVGIGLGKQPISLKDIHYLHRTEHFSIVWSQNCLLFRTTWTALLLRTGMSILRDDKMRPLFQEAIVTKLVVTQSASGYQMKATDIVFPIIPHESLWVRWFGHHSSAKLGIFPK